MKCSFDVNICSTECKKYPICAYYSVQNQVSNIQTQLNFIYDTFNTLLQKIETLDLKINVVEEAFYNFASRVYDSEPMKFEGKESIKNDKENK
jgi:hypothetical protein